MTAANLPAAWGGVKRAVSRLVAKTSEAVLPSPTIARIRALRDWNGWIDGLTADALEDVHSAPLKIKQRLFADNVRRVEIETHAKCNRVCSFCPNAIMDRRRNERLADAAMLDRIFDQLGAIDYRRQICVARYSEPLTNRDYLCDRLRSARLKVPRADLAITTNTDYLTRTALRQLLEAGLNTLYMSLYLRNGEKWSLDVAHGYTNHVAKRIGARIASVTETATSVECTFAFPGLRMSSTCHNWDLHGTDRGGIVKTYAGQTRVGPCRDPFDTFVVDCSGAVMPCCNLRSDLTEHRDMIVGDLSDPGTSIFDVYAGRLADWRRSLVSFGAQTFPCATCRHRDLRADLVQVIAPRLEKKLQSIDRDTCYQQPLAPATPNS